MIALIQYGRLKINLRDSSPASALNFTELNLSQVAGYSLKAKRVDRACGALLDLLPAIVGIAAFIGIGTFKTVPVDIRNAIFAAGLGVTGIWIGIDLTSYLLLRQFSPIVTLMGATDSDKNTQAWTVENDTDNDTDIDHSS